MRCLRRPTSFAAFYSDCCIRFKSSSSTQWLKRQKTDPYVKKAKMEQWRCRSAFKLLEIDQKYKILNPGAVVIDCGAAPGSWTQVAVRSVNANGEDERKPKGIVIGIDLKGIMSIDGAILLTQSDFTTQETNNKILQYLNGRKVDVVLSDMAPNASGIKEMDHAIAVKLCSSVLKFSVENLKNGGTMVCKLWQGQEEGQLQDAISKFFATVKVVKPRASRGDSAEIFFLCRDFRLDN